MSVRKLKLEALKFQARGIMRKRAAFYDRFDCGMRLANHISGEGDALTTELRLVWAQIKVLDPSAPELGL